MTLTNEQMGDALKRVIAAIDKWWVEVTNLKKGEFYRYDLRGSSNLILKSYIEWRYKSGAFEKDYMSLVISLAPARGDTVSIDLNLRKMENGVYTEYDPFCWFQNSNYGVSIDTETGFDKNSMIWDFITINDINHLIDRIDQIIGNKQEDQPVEETGSNDEITNEEEIINTQNETKTGDGLEMLQPNEVLDVLINERRRIKMMHGAQIVSEVKHCMHVTKHFPCNPWTIEIRGYTATICPSDKNMKWVYYRGCWFIVIIDEIVSFEDDTQKVKFLKCFDDSLREAIEKYIDENNIVFQKE